MPVDVLAQPRVQCAELALADLVRDSRLRSQRRLEPASAHDVAQCVALERPTDRPAIPMHVLHDAVPIVGRHDTEITLEALAPGFRQVAYCLLYTSDAADDLLCV